MIAPGDLSLSLSLPPFISLARVWESSSVLPRFNIIGHRYPFRFTEGPSTGDPTCEKTLSRFKSWISSGEKEREREGLTSSRGRVGRISILHRVDTASVRCAESRRCVGGNSTLLKDRVDPRPWVIIHRLRAPAVIPRSDPYLYPPRRQHLPPTPRRAASV